MAVKGNSEELRNILKKTVFIKGRKLSELTEEELENNDKIILSYFSSKKEILFENFTVQVYEELCLLVTFILDETIRSKEILILKEMHSKYESFLSEDEKPSKEQIKEKADSQLLRLSTSLRRKLSNFNEKVKYGDSLLNILITGVRENLENNEFLDKLIDDESNLNPYFIFLVVLIIFIFSFFFVKYF